MVYEQVTRKYPNLTRQDIGLFTNDEGAALISAVNDADVDILVDDASRFEVGMWFPLRGTNGLEVCQIVAVSYPLNMLTVQRGRDGTVPVAHEQGSLLEATITAKAMNQIVEELLQHQAVLNGNVGPVITINADYVISGEDNFLTIFVDCTAGDVTVTLPDIDAPQYYTIKKIAGVPANEVIVEPQPGDDVDGDADARIKYVNSSLTVTNDDDTNWWLI